MPAPITFNRQDTRRASVVQYGSLSGSYGGGFLSGSFPNFKNDVLFDDDLDETAARTEDHFCKNFSCCGKTLDDLHHLLQHYEENHVTIEEQQTSMNMMYNTQHPQQQQHHQQQQTPMGRPKPDIEAMKRRALSDMQYHLAQSEPHHAIIEEDEDVAFDDYSQYGDPFQSRKRSWRPSMSSPSVATRDFFSPTQSPQSTPASSIPSTPTMAISHDFNCEAENLLLFGPPSSSDDWLLSDGRPIMPQIKKVRQTPIHSHAMSDSMPSTPGVIEDPANNMVVTEKPFKCPVPGCYKEYKNQNGLKYHKQHGNCAANPIAFAAAQASGNPVPYVVPDNKPYSCNICPKRYKNLNGLKYHTSHSHQHVTTNSVLKAIQEAGHQQASAIW